MRPVLFFLACYLLGFACWPASVLTVTDEALYLDQALELVTGEPRVGLDPATGDETRERTDAYPLGVATLLAVALATGGLPAAWWVPPLAWAGFVGLVALLLRREGLPAWPAVLAGAFLPALVAGRLLMSDVPSGVVVAAALLAFFAAASRPAGDRAGTGLAALAGLLAGLSMLFRETNCLVLAPFCLGAVLRRERTAWPLFLGGVAGVAVRVASSWLAFGSAFGTRTTSTFGVDALGGNVVTYALALVVLFPAGLVAVACYRGRYAPELKAAVALYLLVFCLYEWRGQDSGFAKSLVLGPRFFVPICPLLALAVADAMSRAWASSRPWKVAVPAVVVAACSVAAFGVHPAMDRWTEGRAAVREAVTAATRDGQVVVTNLVATAKYLHRVHGERRVVDLDRLEPGAAAAILGRDPDVAVLLLERFDSPAWEARNAASRERLAALLPGFGVVEERDFGPEGRLVVLGRGR